MPTSTIYTRLYNPLDADKLMADIDPLHRDVVNDFYDENTSVISVFINDLHQVSTSSIKLLFQDDTAHFLPIFTVVREGVNTETVLAIISLVPSALSMPIHFCRHFSFSLTQTKTAVNLPKNDGEFQVYLKAIESIIATISQALPIGSVCTTLVHEKTLPFVKKVLATITPHSNSFIHDYSGKDLNSKYYWVHIDTSVISKEPKPTKAEEPLEAEEPPKYYYPPFRFDDEVDPYLYAIVKIYVDNEYLGQWPLRELELFEIDKKFYFKIVKCHPEDWNLHAEQTLLLSRTQTEEIKLMQSSYLGLSEDVEPIYEWHGISNESQNCEDIYEYSLERHLDNIDLKNYPPY